MKISVFSVFSAFSEACSRTD